MGSVVDIDAFLRAAPDNFSRFLSRFIAFVMDLDHLNSFYDSLPVKVGESNFASLVLDSLSISRLVKGYSLPSKGPLIVVVPVVSGILEVIASISEIIENNERNDIKIIPISNVFQSFDFLSPYYLKSKKTTPFSLISSAIAHLKNGGVLIYFVRISSVKITVDSSFIFPYKLSRLSKSPIVNVLIDFDANLKFSWTTIGNWIYFFFSIRRFFANSGTSMLTIFSDSYNFDGINITETYVRQHFRQFFLHNSKSLGDNSIFKFSSSSKNKHK